jgi:sarcosine oxidase
MANDPNTGKSADVVIIGGGVIGSSIATWLGADPGFDGTVMVIERDRTYARASTPLSAGGIRQQFSIRENIEMGLHARDFLRSAAEHLSVDGEPPELTFREAGYLFLASAEGRTQLAENHALQTECGAAIAWLDRAALAARFPWLRTEDLAAGCFGESGEGWIDPNALLQAFKRKARSLGAVYRDAEVVEIGRTATRAHSVTLDDGSRIEAGTIVIAAGPNSGAVGRMAGIDIPVGPRKRSVFVFDCRTPLWPEEPGRLAPLTIDTSGVFVRPEGSGFICGVSPPEDQDPETWDDEVDWPMWDDVVWPALAHRIPAFEAIKPTGAWAGWYDYNSLDQNALIGPHPELDGLLVATGFSGHGLQQAPSIGRAVMELITMGRYRSIDLQRFGVDRVLSGETVKEKNVV